ncbi:hypothetical protein EPN87_01795 [archaeon]|nr:MAG: hypothetical protein EPN87_01795 [archaeon]
MPSPVWKFEDDCFSPEQRIKLEFTGPDPIKIAHAMRPLLVKIFEVEAIDLWERDFRWDTTGAIPTFYQTMYASRGFDAHTSIFIEIIIQGQQPKEKGANGKVTCLVGGKIRTEYRLDSFFKKTPLYKAIRWVYNIYFYNEVRRGYIKLCVRLTDRLLNEMRAVLGMPLKPGVFR